MRKDWIRKRQRKTQQISGIMRLANQTSVSNIISSVANVTECPPQPPPQCSALPYEATTQSHGFPSTYSSCDPVPIPEYKQVDYVQYYTTDYNSAVFQSSMVPVHDSHLTGQEMATMAQPVAHGISTVASIPYLSGMQNYSVAPISESYLHSYEDIKPQQ